ncbi:MAG: hypothetical protein GF364_08065 [Candidatus Lokiarchaeota archaeon]|nr:hypothetical protein [Candidatus Lokiarchaeota archaeon]
MLYPPKFKIKRYLWTVLCISVFFIIIISSITILGENKPISDMDPYAIEQIDDFSIHNMEASSDSTTYYRYNTVYISNEQFSDETITPWTSDSSGGTINFGSGLCTLTVTEDTKGDRDDCPKLVLDPDPFLEGYFNISWSKNDLESLQGDKLEIVYKTTSTASWDDATRLAECTRESSSGDLEQQWFLDDDTHGTKNVNFKIAIILKAEKTWGGNDYGYINYATLQTWEYIFEEGTAEPVPQQNDQPLDLFVFSELANFAYSYTTIQYQTESSSFSGSEDELPPDTINDHGLRWASYSFTIPEEYYDWDDTFYYRINIEGTGWTSHSDTYGPSNFDAYDNTDPSFGADSFDPTSPEYDDNIQYTIYCEEQYTGDSQINSMTMYVKNSTGVTESDYAIPTSTSLPTLSGNFIFNIPQEITYWDELHYFVKVTDNAGHSVSTTPTYISINDNDAPDLYEYPSNEDDQNYLEDNYLLFDVSEPIDASGLDTANLQLTYGTDPTLSSGTTTIGYDSVNGDTYNFTIPESDYGGDTTFYYQLDGQDFASNTFQTTIKSFDVIDLEPPSLSLNAENYSLNPYYYEKVYLEFVSDDVGGGAGPYSSGFDNISMYVNNGTSPLTSWESSIQILGEDLGSNTYRFNIDSIHLSARDNLYWLASAIDVGGNYQNMTGNFQVYDDVIPSIKFSSISPGSEIDHSVDADVYFEIEEELGGSGFELSSDSLQVFYKIGSEPSDALDGTALSCPETLDPYAGTFRCEIPESFFAYTERVYYWGNLTDRSGNSNTTFDAGNVRYFDVIDITAPNIVVDSVSFDDNSYQLDKDINFTVTEPSDSSLMNSATLYWALENPSVSSTPGNHDGSRSILVSGTGGYENITILTSEITGIYGEKIYFVIEAVDNENNKKTTLIYYFTISDNIAPDIDQGSKNTLDMLNDRGKTFTVEVWDPDYPTSSGIESITIYYRIDNDDVGTAGDKHDGTLSPSIAIMRSRSEYEIELTPEVSYDWENESVIWYIISVTDIKGNEYLTTKQSFSVFDGFDVIFTSPAIADENEQDYYYNTSQITLSVTSEVICDKWYELDGQDFMIMPHTGLNFQVVLTDLTEGYHNITVYYFNSLYYQVLEFYMDFTIPNPATSLTTSMFGSYISISWVPPNDADSLTSYQVWRKRGNRDWEKIATTEISATQYLDTDVAKGNTYEYKVITVDRAGNMSDFSTTVSMSTGLPSWITFIIIIGAAAVGIGVFQLVKFIRKDKSLRDLGELSQDERSEFFDAEESKNQDYDVSQSSKSSKKIKPKSDEEELFADTSEIKEELWQQVDWKSKAVYMDKVTKQWKKNVEEISKEALKYELKGDLAHALQLYKLAARAAEKFTDIDLDLFDFLRAKIFNIYSNPLKK